MLSFSNDIKNVDDYYSFKGGNKELCYAEGKRWLSKYNFKHEWVFDQNQPLSEKINNMKIALKYSPLAIAVYAWFVDDRGIYIRMGQDTHWTSQIAYKDNMKIFDSYSPVEKIVDQEIYFCKRIHIDKIVTSNTIKLPIWQRLLKWLQKQLNIISYFND